MLTVKENIQIGIDFSDGAVGRLHADEPSRAYAAAGAEIPNPKRQANLQGQKISNAQFEFWIFEYWEFPWDLDPGIWDFRACAVVARVQRRINPNL